MGQYPSRIVCLTEETTETLYLLGMGDCIVGVSGYTARPAAARKKPRVSAFTHARYDRIDLSDGAIVGGIQDALGLSAIWMPTDYVRFLVNYGHLWVGDAAVPAELYRDYQVDTVGVRAQFDF